MNRELKSILVTGGSGFIGSHFVRYLLGLEQTEQVCNVDALTYAGNPHNLTDCSDDARYHFFHNDINDRPAIEKILAEYNIDTVVHFAAESHVDRSIEGPAPFIESNITGTFNLLEAVRNAGRPIHFHHVSTDEVYGSLGPEGLFTEETPYAPNSPYSASKASSDHLVRAYHHTYGMSTTISNCSNNYGPYQFPEKLIPVIIYSCLENKPIPVYGDGKNIRDWLYVVDHVTAIYAVAGKGQTGETYNIGTNNEWTNIDLVKKICSVTAGLKGLDEENYLNLITFVKDRPGHDRRYALQVEKIKNHLGWVGEYKFEDALKETIAWYLDNGQWRAAILDGSYRNL